MMNWFQRRLYKGVKVAIKNPDSINIVDIIDNNIKWMFVVLNAQSLSQQK